MHRNDRDIDKEHKAANIADLIRRKADVIVDLWGDEPAKVTRTIPIVVVHGRDAVKLGYARSYAQPGGNVTGMLAEFGYEVDDKSFELLHEVVPGAKRIAVLRPRPLPGGPPANELEGVRSFAKARSLELVDFEVGGDGDFANAFERMRAAQVTALWMPGNTRFGSFRPHIAALALKHRLPLGGTGWGIADDGALVEAEADLTYNYRRVAEYIDKILRGARPGDLPLEQSTRSRTVVNAKTARALGLVLPPSVLVRADRVVE